MMRWRIGISLTPLQKFSIVTLLGVLAVTVVVCGVGARLLIHHLVAHDAVLTGDLARLLLTRSLPVSHFVPTASPDPSRYEDAIHEIAASPDVVLVILYDAQSQVLWSDDAALRGRRFPENRELQTALHGRIEAKVIRPGKAEHQKLVGAFERIEEIYLPVRYAKDGPVVAVLEIYRYPPTFFAVLDRVLALVWMLGGGGGVVLYASLLAVARFGPVPQGVLGVELIAERRRTEEALRRMNETLEAETKRIAHEVHDEAGQLIATVQFALADAAREMTPSAQESLRKVTGVLDEIADQLRRLSHELRPTILDHLGLVPALEFLAQGVMKRTALGIHVEGFADGRLPLIIETALYRVVQEALTNVVKHACARSVAIRVDREPGSVRCSIRDDGVGFDAVAVSRQTRATGLGLLGIAHRVEAVGGTLEIVARPGQGTALMISIPLS